MLTINKADLADYGDDLVKEADFSLPGGASVNFQIDKGANHPVWLSMDGEIHGIWMSLKDFKALRKLLKSINATLKA